MLSFLAMKKTWKCKQQTVQRFYHVFHNAKRTRLAALNTNIQRNLKQLKATDFSSAT